MSSLLTLASCALGADVVTISSLTLRVEWDGKPIVFSAAELVLQGPGGTKAVPLFENSSRWRAAAGVTVAQVGLCCWLAVLLGTNERVRVRQTTEPLPGGRSAPALVWSLPSGKGGQAGALFMTTELSLSFDCKQFTELHIDWRLSRNVRHHHPRFCRPIWV